METIDGGRGKKILFLVAKERGSEVCACNRCMQTLIGIDNLKEAKKNFEVEFKWDEGKDGYHVHIFGVE